MFIADLSILETVEKTEIIGGRRSRFEIATNPRAGIGYNIIDDKSTNNSSEIKDIFSSSLNSFVDIKDNYAVSNAYSTALGPNSFTDTRTVTQTNPGKGSLSSSASIAASSLYIW